MPLPCVYHLSGPVYLFSFFQLLSNSPHLFPTLSAPLRRDDDFHIHSRLHQFSPPSPCDRSLGLIHTLRAIYIMTLHPNGMIKLALLEDERQARSVLEQSLPNLW